MNTVRVLLVRRCKSKTEVLLVFEKEQKKQTEDGKTFSKRAGCGLPGGRVQGDLAPHETAVKELKEETGLSATVYPEPILTIKKENGTNVIIFGAIKPKGELKPQDPQIVGARWINWGDLQESVSGNRPAINFNDTAYPVYRYMRLFCLNQNVETFIQHA